MNKDSVVFYVLLAISCITAAASILTLNLLLIILSSIVIIVTLVCFKLWYVIDSLIFKHTNLIQLFSGYELSGDRSSAIRRAEGRITATTVALLFVDKKGDIDKSKIENIITHVDYPFKFTMQLERLDVKKLLDKLQTKRNINEITLSRLDTSSSRHTAKINQIKREIEQISHDIENISSGEMPLKLAYYIMTSAMSDSLYDAEERAKSQIRGLSNQFAALLNSKAEILTGEALLRALELDSTMVLS